jgi:glycosyltransferase involved in cell wall biosynthesis
MPLTVLNVGFPLATVSPCNPGGAEQILALLDEALVKAGYRSIVVAPAGSSCRGTLLPVSAVESHLDQEKHATACQEQRSTIEKALSDFPIDLIHMHGIDFHRYLPATDVPVLVTLHLPPAWYPREIFSPERRRDFRLVCVSRSQAGYCPAEAQIEAVIENGVSLPQFHSTPKESYVTALGRICPEKGFHLALDAATKAGLPLVLAGKVFGYPSHEQYWNEELKPRIKPPHRFLGPVGSSEKQELLSRARCLVVSSLVDETSSLVAMEAMACGTPVVALRRGALSEIVEEGRTGFVVDSPEQLPDAMLAARRLSPITCREQAVARFSSLRMTARYLRVYEHLTTQPRGTFQSNAEWVV